MNLDQDFLLGLVANWPQWRDAGPIENAQIVKVAFGSEEVSFAERLALPDGEIGDRPNQGGTRLISAEDVHLTDAREISLLDDVDHINRMRIVWSARSMRFTLRIRIAAIEILGDNLIAIFFEQLRGIRFTWCQIQFALSYLWFYFFIRGIDDEQVMDLILFAFRDTKRHVELRFVIADLRSYRYILEAGMFI